MSHWTVQHPTNTVSKWILIILFCIASRSPNGQYSWYLISATSGLAALAFSASFLVLTHKPTQFEWSLNELRRQLCSWGCHFSSTIFTSFFCPKDWRNNRIYLRFSLFKQRIPTSWSHQEIWDSFTKRLDFQELWKGKARSHWNYEQAVCRAFCSSLHMGYGHSPYFLKFIVSTPQAKIENARIWGFSSFKRQEFNYLLRHSL